jgi:putative endonuclease
MTAEQPPAAPPRDEARAAAFRVGLSAEGRAAALLVANGYAIAARRFRTPAGEIDIVARRGNELVFVEVKARGRRADAAEALTPRQRRRIVAAAEIWLRDHPDDGLREIRFDVVLVPPRGRPTHLAAAFDASG